MHKELKAKALGAAAWSTLEQLSSQGVRFVVGVVLARLLLPAEFGLLGMLAVFLTVAQVFVNCGFGSALIQKQDCSRLDESSVFFFNVLIGLVCACALWGGAPLVANFYRQPQLVLLTRLMAADVLINSFALVQTMLLTRDMDFKTQLKVSLIANLISGIGAIAMAWRGAGVLSLVAQILVGDSLRVVLLWWHLDWRPLARFSLASLRRLFPFSSRLLASGLLDAIFQNLYSMIIGRLFAPATLGFYTRARQVQQLPATNLGIIVSRVSFPLFCNLQADRPSLKAATRKTLVLIAMLSFPLMAGLACVAAPLVRVLFTDKWLPCAGLLQIFCVTGAVYPLHVIHLSVLMALGRSELFLRLEIIKKLLTLSAIALTFHFGLKALVLGEAGLSLVCYFINAQFSVKLLGYTWKEQLQDLAPYLALSAAMGLAAFSAGSLGIVSPSVLLCSQVGAGVAVYVGGCFLCRLSAFRDVWHLLQERLAARRRPVPV